MPSFARRCLAEGMGTFFLVFVGVGAMVADTESGALGPVGVALGFGAVVACMVYSVGHLSGAHLNPAVTFAFASVRRFPTREIPGYVASQIVGAWLGAAMLDRTVGLAGSIGVTTPSVPISAAVALELTTTFALMFVIAAVATDERAARGLAGVAIGLAVTMGALVAGPHTGGSMNPARSMGPALVAGGWTTHWIYWIAPVLGATLAAGAYEAVRTPAQVASAVGAQAPSAQTEAIARAP